MKPDKKTSTNGAMKVLNAPVHLGSMVDHTDPNIDDVKSIWLIQRDDTLVS